MIENARMNDLGLDGCGSPFLGDARQAVFGGPQMHMLAFRIGKGCCHRMDAVDQVIARGGQMTGAAGQVASQGC